MQNATHLAERLADGRARRRRRAPASRSRRASASPPSDRRGAASSSPPPTSSCRCACRSTPRSRSPAPSSSRRGSRRRSSARSPDQVTLAADGHRRPRAHHGRRAASTRCTRIPPTTSRGCPEIDPERVFDARPRGASSPPSSGSSGAASRDESRPVLTGVLVHFETGRADHGRHRLLPPGGQGDGARGRGARAARGDRPGPRAAEVARLAGRAAAAPSTCSVDRNQVALRRRRRLAHRAPHRGPVPELPLAAAGQASSTSVRLPRDELAEIVKRVGVFARHNAPLRVRASPPASSRSRRRRPTSARRARPCRPRSAASAFEIGFNPDFLRDGIEAVGGDEARAAPDQPAAAGAAHGPRRRLLVPDHADPADLGGSPGCASTASGLVGLPLLRGGSSRRSPAGVTARRRAQRRRQDEPARGRAPRPAATRRAPRPTSRCIRDGAPFLRVEVGRRRGRRHGVVGVALAPGEPRRHHRRRRAPRSRRRALDRAVRVPRLPARAPRRREARAGRAPRLPRPRGGAALSRPTRATAAAPTRRALAQRNALLRRIRAGARHARAPRSVGRAARRSTAPR